MMASCKILESKKKARCSINKVVVQDRASLTIRSTMLVRSIGIYSILLNLAKKMWPSGKEYEIKSSKGIFWHLQ